MKFCISYYKIQSIFQCLVKSDVIYCSKLDGNISELRKKESFRGDDGNQLSNLHLLKENICNLAVSLSKNKGKILNKFNDRHAKFFD
jgi:hypothetical protein